MRSTLCLAPLLLAACAGEQWGTSGGSALLAPAHSRAVISTQVSHFADNGRRPMPTRITCAEASPDAIVASTTQLAASLSSNLAGVGGRTNDLQAALALGFAQQVGFVGMRTATIQAIRDLGFRMCEAYANGLLTDTDFKQILGGTDGILLGMHAIDALAGVQRPGAMVIGQQIGVEAETTPRPRAGSGNGGGAPGATPAADVIPASNGNAPGPSGAAPGAASSITPGSPPSVSASATSAAADPQAIAAIAAEIRRIVCVTVQQAPLRRGQKNSNRFVGEVCNAPPVRIAASATRR